jgi:hypothetical protein
VSLVNVQEMEASDHFEKPDMDWLRHFVEVGSYVKICHSEERFWCYVRAIEDDVIMALVSNKLVRAPFKLGDPVMFGYENIFDVADREFGQDDLDETENMEHVHSTCNKMYGERNDEGNLN